MSREDVPPDRPRRGGLFARIFLTFLATAVASAIVAAVAGFTFAARFSADWIEEATEAIDAHGPQLQAAVHDPEQLDQAARELGERLDSRVGIYERRGRRIAGEGPPRLPRGALRQRRQQLRAGKPVVLPRGRLEPPGIAYALFDPQDGRVAQVVAVMPRPGFRLMIPMVALALMIPVLGGGAWILSRSLTRRLARIEASADRIARGELQHRIELEHEIPRDELDQLGRAFNEMAGKVEALLQGQRTLLANVSHELRTPIARMKVLVEILQERIDALRAEGNESRPVQRLHKGLGDLGVDIDEVERLISDLLTSGRLELRHGAATAIDAHHVDAGSLLRRVADKVGARVEVSGSPSLHVDELLVERLLSNLLANARRACPHGEIVVAARSDGDRTELTVTDEGPGVAPENRETIFEPFTRLDHARDRDRGGVGLGLYLCRQICLAHDGSIEVTGRPDGASGARFVVELPAKPA